MSDIAPPLVPSAEVVRRVLLAESHYTRSRLTVLRDLPGNPVRVEVRDLGDGALAMRARFIPNVHFNRVTGLGEAHVSDVGRLTAWYRDIGIRGAFDVIPGFTPDGVTAALRAEGFSHHRFHTNLCARPARAPATAPGVTAETVDAATLDEFLDCHCRGWGVGDPEGFKANVRGWLNAPGWNLYLGRHYDQPAGTAILYEHQGTGYCADSACDPAFRGRGVHAALLHRRLEDAGELGCDLVCSGADFLSTSQRNMIRAGFTTLHTKSIWTLGGAW